MCGGDCDWAPNVNPGEPIEDGLYIGVTVGVIVFRAPGGEIVVHAGEYAFIPMTSRVPERLDAPPSVLIDDNDLRFDANGTPVKAGFDEKLGPRRSPGSTALDPQDRKQGTQSLKVTYVAGASAGAAGSASRLPPCGQDCWRPSGRP